MIRFDPPELINSESLFFTTNNFEEIDRLKDKYVDYHYRYVDRYNLTELSQIKTLCENTINHFEQENKKEKELKKLHEDIVFGRL